MAVTTRHANSQYIKGLLTLIVIAITGFVVSAFAYIFYLDSIAPEESDAIYGGQIAGENVYPYAGFLVSYSVNNRASLCGLIYLNPNLAISAAHCFDNKNRAYLGYSLFNSNIDQLFLTQDIISNPNWDRQTSNDDLAIINLPREFYNPRGFAQVASPSKGCNYEVLGYGKNDDGEIGDVQRLRKTGRMCITDFDSDLLFLKGDGAGICSGDSGSPVFETGTDRVVGIISSIIPATNNPNGDPCAIGNTALAVRLDTQSQFISTYSNQSNMAKCGESCGSNADCANGLNCSGNGICLGSAGRCVVNTAEFCSEYLNIECNEGLVCSTNECKSQADVDRERNILVADLSDSNAAAGGDFEDGVVYQLIVYALVFSTIAIVPILLYVILKSRNEHIYKQSL